MKRRTAREKAVQCLFKMDVAGAEMNDALAFVLEDNEEDSTYLRHLVMQTWENRATIDEEIKKYLRGWQLERIANVDRAILRLAFYELMHEVETPPKVVLNEAIELAKLFSDEQSTKFINGVLSAYLQSRQLA